MQKVKYSPTFSTGNVTTIIAGIFVAAGVWVALEVGIAKAQAHAEQNTKVLDDLESRVSRLEQRMDKRLDSIENKVDKLLDRSK